jgi:hypothetical protein
MIKSSLRTIMITKKKASSIKEGTMSDIKCELKDEKGVCLRYNIDFWDAEHFPGGYAGG